VLKVTVNHMDSTGRPYALVMKKGSVAPCSLPPVAGFDRSAKQYDQHPTSKGSELPGRHDVLLRLVETTNVEETVLIASTGFSGRELYALDDRPNQFYMVGSMGCAASLGLGLSLVRPDKKVIVIDGDGSTLMRMGNLATVGAYAGENYYHLLLDNNVHESTGGQATVSSVIEFAAVAAACGYRYILHATGEPPHINSFLQSKAPAFMHIETSRGIPDGLPRPSIKPKEVARRLMTHLGVDTLWKAVH